MRKEKCYLLLRAMAQKGSSAIMFIKEELSVLTEEERYKVIGLEDGWIEPSNDLLEFYYNLKKKIKEKIINESKRRHSK